MSGRRALGPNLTIDVADMELVVLHHLFVLCQQSEAEVTFDVNYGDQCKTHSGLHMNIRV